jgi:hypothetical protein
MIPSTHERGLNGYLRKWLSLWALSEIPLSPATKEYDFMDCNLVQQ